MMNNEYLAHFGIKGQKWGVRRFQNEDMSLTPAGKERYGSGEKSKSLKGRIVKTGHTLVEKNNSEEAKKYKEAYAQEKKALKNVTKDSKGNYDWDAYDKATNEAAAKREAAFKESKAAYKASQTKGHKIANTLINGPIGAGVYNNMRAAGYSKAVSEGVTIASGLLGGPIGHSAAYFLTRKGQTQRG